MTEFLISHKSTVNYEIPLNESVCGTITPHRELRQGDPLSPFLFILSSEVLLRLLLREEATRNLHKIKISENGLVVSHLMYVDDLTLACRANEQNARVAKQCYDLYNSRFG